MLLEALQQKGSAASSSPKPNAETSQQLFLKQVGAFTLTPGEKRPPGKTGEDIVVSKWNNHSDYSTKGPKNYRIIKLPRLVYFRATLLKQSMHMSKTLR